MDPHAEDEAAEGRVTAAAGASSYQVSPSEGVTTFVADNVSNRFGLGGDAFFVAIEALEIGENDGGFCHAVLGDEPTACICQHGRIAPIVFMT